MRDAITTAQAREAGIARTTLRSRNWTRVSQGIYRPSLDPDEAAALEQHLADVSPALPVDASFAHLTAASMYGLWVPPPPAWLAVLASQAPGTDRPERPGLHVFRSRAGAQGRRRVGGFPVVSPQVCLGQLAEDFSVLDLTIAIDSALHHRLCSIIDIESAIRARQRGLPRLRRALALCDPRSESPWETILRLIHVSADIEVEPQAKIRDEFGDVMARADLRIKGTCRLAEYDGAVHRERGQHESDLRRDKRLSRLGVERYGYIATELVNNPQQIIRDAEKALGLPHDPTRVLAWNELAHPSTLTRDGRRRLMHRLHRFD